LLSSFNIFNRTAFLPSFRFCLHTFLVLFSVLGLKIKERNHIDLYLKGAWFEFMLGNRLPWRWFSWFYHVAYARERYFRNPFQIIFIPSSYFIPLFFPLRIIISFYPFTRIALLSFQFVDTVIICTVFRLPPRSRRDPPSLGILRNTRSLGFIDP